MQPDRPATAWVCRACGVQYAPTPEPPAECPICLDERQYVPVEGQAWAGFAELEKARQGYEIRELEPGLTGLRCLPQLGIGPVGYLVQTPAGNLLWDCPSHVGEQIAAEVRSRGGLAAISASHPHFYGAMADWAMAFAAPILLPEADRRWVMRRDAPVRFWQDSVELLPGLVAVRCGGHFEGSSVLHWPAGAGGRGVLFTGDTIMVIPDRRHVSFMRSYPNLIPLPATAVAGIAAAVERLRFDRIYGNPGWEKVMATGAREAVARSADRYRKASR